MNDTDKKLSVDEGYRAMYHYLNALYEMTGSDDLAGFLGGMSLTSDGSPADPAVLQDWHETVDKALGEAGVNQHLS